MHAIRSNSIALPMFTIMYGIYNTRFLSASQYIGYVYSIRTASDSKVVVALRSMVQYLLNRQVHVASNE